MPARRRNCVVIETPRVRAALNALRRELGDDGVDLEELVVPGAGAKLDMLRAERDRGTKLQALADRFGPGAPR